MDYTINVNYLGTTALENVVITDTVPVGTTYVGGSANAGGMLSVDGSKVIWSLGSGAPGKPGVTSPQSTALCYDEVTYTNPLATDSIVLDTYVRQDAPTTNYGAATVIQTHPETNKFQHSLLYFNLASQTIPAGADIIKADLKLTVTGARTKHTDDLYRMTTPWTEAGATWNDPDGAGADVWNVAAALRQWRLCPHAPGQHRSGHYRPEDGQRDQYGQELGQRLGAELRLCIDLHRHRHERYQVCDPARTAPPRAGHNWWSATTTSLGAHAAATVDLSIRGRHLHSEGRASYDCRLSHHHVHQPLRQRHGERHQPQPGEVRPGAGPAGRHDHRRHAEDHGHDQPERRPQVAIHRMITPWTEAGASWGDSNGATAGDWSTGTFGSGDYANTSLGSFIAAASNSTPLTWEPPS